MSTYIETEIEAEAAALLPRRRSGRTPDRSPPHGSPRPPNQQEPQPPVDMPTGRPGNAANPPSPSPSTTPEVPTPRPDPALPSDPPVGRPGPKPPTPKPAEKPPTPKPAEKPPAPKPAEKPPVPKPAEKPPVPKPTSPAPADLPLVEKAAEKSAIGVTAELFSGLKGWAKIGWIAAPVVFTAAVDIQIMYEVTDYITRVYECRKDAATDIRVCATREIGGKVISLEDVAHSFTKENLKTIKGQAIFCPLIDSAYQCFSDDAIVELMEKSPFVFNKVKKIAEEEKELGEKGLEILAEYKKEHPLETIWVEEEEEKQIVAAVDHRQFLLESQGAEEKIGNFCRMSPSGKVIQCFADSKIIALLHKRHDFYEKIKRLADADASISSQGRVIQVKAMMLLVKVLMLDSDDSQEK